MIVAGVDCGIRKVAISYLTDKGIISDITVFQTFKDYTRGEQLSLIHDYVSRDLSDHGVDQVFIEENLTGNNRRYSGQLAQVVGVVSAAGGIRVQYVNVSSWKKLIVGKGNATKEDVRLYIDSCHPEYSSSCEGDQDRYDATCVALYGLRLLELADGLRLAKR